VRSAVSTRRKQPTKLQHFPALAPLDLLTPEEIADLRRDAKETSA